MKTILFVVALCVAVTVQSFAQQGPPKRSAEERAAIFVKNLGKEMTLTEEQSTKITAIQLETFKKVDEIREKGMTGGDRKAMRQDVKAANDAAEVSIKALLTDEQKTKFDAWQAKKREEMKNRQGGGNN